MEFENGDTHLLMQSFEQVANAIRSVLKSNVIGVYLTGSAVLGDWHYGKSDLDFTVVTNDPIARETVALLEKQIKSLESKRPSVKLEIQYIPVSILGKCKEEVEPILAYHDKKHSMSYFNFNPVTWYTLEKYGAVVWGKPIGSFNLKTTKDELSAYVYENVNTYWRAWGSSAAKIFTKKGVLSFTDWAVEWCVCGLSRMYYTLREQDITSKCGALDYMLDKLPQEYQGILKEAKAIRLRSGQKFFSSRAGRRRSMLKYVDHVIDLCQRSYRS
ncbi:MAG: aminoglycoside adenylyltransferase domain-containing protein [Clostridiaceae bacterium]